MFQLFPSFSFENLLQNKPKATNKYKYHSGFLNQFNWEEAKIIGRERRWNQRKLLEGIESLRQKDQGITPLNSYNQLEQWQSTLSRCFGD